MLLIGCQRLGLSPADTAIIGDRLDTDIVGGYRAGLRTLLVLTGVSTRAEAEAAEVKPDGSSRICRRSRPPLTAASRLASRMRRTPRRSSAPHRESTGSALTLALAERGRG